MEEFEADDLEQYEDKPKKKHGCLSVIGAVVVALICINFIRGFIGGFKATVTTPQTTVPITTGPTTTKPINPIEVSEGERLLKNSYFISHGIKFTCLGDYKFLIENGTEHDYIIVPGIYGKKKDGTYKWLATPAFYGVDEYQYQKDLEEDGWATYNITDRVRSGEALEMTMYIADLSDDSLDVDRDGMYDICFTLHKQTDPEYISTSSDSPCTPYFKIAAE